MQLLFWYECKGAFTTFVNFGDVLLFFKPAQTSLPSGSRLQPAGNHSGRTPHINVKSNQGIQIVQTIQSG